MSPTARTLAELRRLGYVAEVVERWIPRTKIRVDLFGTIDVVAVREGECLGVQATSGSNAAARLNKAKAEPRLAAWLRAGCRFEVWSWRLAGVRGARKVWTLRRVSLALEELEAA